MFGHLRRWIETGRLKSSKPEPMPEASPEPQTPPDPPGQARVKITFTDADGVSVVDVDTGRSIPVFAIDWSWDIRDRNTRTPTAVLRTYNRDFEYRGRATVLKVCPKCKAVMDAERDAIAALPPPASPPSWYGELLGMTRAYDQGRL